MQRTKRALALAAVIIMMGALLFGNHAVTDADGPTPTPTPNIPGQGPGGHGG